jgi:conjugal transfer pilus assembly protein TraV
MNEECMQTTLLFKLGLGLSMMVFLSGCSSLNSEFDCPMKPGVMCQSLDQVNSMVDQGKLGATPTPCLECERLRNEHVSSTCKEAANTIPPEHALRTQDSVARIWIAPFEDSEGDYYAANTVYHVMKPSHWSNHPVKTDSEGETL